MRSAHLLYFMFFTLLSSALAAQLRADFTLDKTGGCSPLVISFTNTTSGATSAATYQWELGNGNTSVLKDAGAIYYEEKTYTVKLTVNDGTQRSTQTKTVTVYKRPVVDFNFSPDNGCLPLAVNFNSASSVADGQVTNYHWDFGDGSTQSTAGSSINHTYNFKQKATVSLTAVSNYGCSNTLTKENIINVHPSLHAGFNADKTILCDAPGIVKFTNTTTGPGVLSYEWDFGDGTQSVEQSPVHTYTTKGIYSVKLSVRSSEGCSDVLQRNGYINVADFSTDISIPPLVCETAMATFNNITSTQPNQTTWRVDGNTAYYSNSRLDYTFYSAGTHTIEVINSFGNCQQSVSKQVEVKPKPKPNGFIADIKGLCGAPVTVDFKDTTAGAVSWQWNFNYYADYSAVHATSKVASYTYQTDNWYYVNLTVKNADGCSASTMNQVAISKPLVYILVRNGTDYQGCAPYTTQFEYRSSEPLTDFQWDFGDGKKSTVAAPEHTFVQPGKYTVSLTYTMANGCTGTVYFNSVEAIQKPEANFTVQPVVCGNTPVSFLNTSTGPYSYYYWDFGDNTGLFHSTSTHQYQQEGEYNVSLILSSFFNTCKDTITKNAIIKVVPPFAKIDGFQNTCDDTRGVVTLFDGSRQATGWHWDFGDGETASYTTARPSVTHLYKASGTFKVFLTVTNGQCSVKDSMDVYVLLKKQPQLSFDATSVCINKRVMFTISGLDLNPYKYYTYWHPYNILALIYEDGTTVPGIIGHHGSDGTSVSGSLDPEQIRNGRIRAIISPVIFDCIDTTNYVSLDIIGSQAAFEVSPNACFKTPVVFKDLSTASSGVSIIKWNWNFGDGTQVTSSQGGTISHQYHSPGNYYVSLEITDANGCSAYSPYYTQSVDVAGPRAAFTTSSGNVVQLNTTVNFYNNTNTAYTNGVSYQWDFGNGMTSTAYSPSMTYTVAGEYVVTLIARNTQTQCNDTARQTITVKNFNTGFTTNTSFIGDHGSCPPVRASFANISSNYTRLIWDFGDGFTLEDQPNPSHVYNEPGTYIVTLTVHGYNGLTGVFKDTVFVNVPEAAFRLPDNDGCIGDKITLDAFMHSSGISYSWDFGNGHTMNTSDSVATHTYLAPGSFAPALVVTNAGGCSAAVHTDEVVTIHPNPPITISPFEAIVCKNTGVMLQASGGVSYLWSPAAGLDNINSATPTAQPSTTITYKVIGTDANGCSNTANATILVPAPFTLTISENAEVCEGSSVQLNVAGAHTYQWIQSTVGLSNTQVANPVASPLASTTYKVAGFDEFQCYSDTAEVSVVVRALPSVNAGADREVVYGSENILAISNSPDVTRWHWTPADFLNCTDCPSPVSRPQRLTEYVIEVFNDYNCSAKDTVMLKATCTQGGIYIPTAFSPNYDGNNDLFVIRGTGVRIIKSLRIYNRWGEIIFEKKDFYPNDNSNGWSGRYKGIDQPSESYVYFVEMECSAGEMFTRKGTVTIVR